MLQLTHNQGLERDQKSVLSSLWDVFTCVCAHACGSQKTASDEISWEPTTLILFLLFILIQGFAVAWNLVSRLADKLVQDPSVIASPELGLQIPPRDFIVSVLEIE